MVYFVWQVGTGLVKIGSSCDPWRRLRELSVGSPYELKLVYVTKCFDEKAVHRALTEMKVKGEWYEIGWGEISRLGVDVLQKWGVEPLLLPVNICLACGEEAGELFLGRCYECL